MKFKLIIDNTKEEEVVATVHQRSNLTDSIELMILQHTGTDRIAGYTEDDIRLLSFSEIECITIYDGKTYAIHCSGNHYRLKQRLYELEDILPSFFIRINKSTLANETRLERFRATFSGGVDAIFQSGFTEYVSRRCFAQIKRRLDEK